MIEVCFGCLKWVLVVWKLCEPSRLLVFTGLIEILFQ
jgi:hypothetical protein